MSAHLAGRTDVIRRLIGAVILLAAVAMAATTVSALTVSTTTVARIGIGAARLTSYTNGTGSLYVNLKGLTPGAWNEHLWTGTCASLGTRVAVLPGLRVPAGGAIARTNALTAAQLRGRTLRIVHGDEVRCATFGATAGPSASASPSGSATASPSGSATASPSGSATASPSGSATASPSSSPSDTPEPTGSDDH